MSSTRIHRILEEIGTVDFPGIYDTLSAKLTCRAGFRTAFISGYSVAATVIGKSDLELLTQTEMIERARRICECVDIPIIVDIDTGYGNPRNVFRTIKELIAVGAGGCLLEDRQTWPGNGENTAKSAVIGREEYLQKIRAAVAARGSADFFIVARTYAATPAGMDEAVARMTAARNEGADACYFEDVPSIDCYCEDVPSIDLFAEIPHLVPKPIMVEPSEAISRQQLVEMGFQLIVYGVHALLAAAWAIDDMYQDLRIQGGATSRKRRISTLDEWSLLIGEEEYKEQQR